MELPKVKDSLYRKVFSKSHSGKIDGAQYKFYNNGGWNTDCSPDVTATAMLHVDNAYAFPNMQVFVWIIQIFFLCDIIIDT